ncbi:MAG: UvrD-helicase domain-containing protein [Isosphaeraceae bacterium]
MIEKSSNPQKLNPDQQAAVDVQGVSVALKAGAGCGKTMVLTERYLTYLDGRNDRLGTLLRSIVALTFTEKAARELRGRVRDACRKHLEPGKTDRAYWRAILRGLEAAPISTFHGFCGELLRRFAVEAKIDPGFAILEESLAPSVRAEALDGCVRAWLAQSNDDLIALAVEFGLTPVREALSDLLANRASADVRAWSGKTPGEVVATWKRVWDEKCRRVMLETLVKQSQPCLDLLKDNACTHKVMNQRRTFLLEHLPGLSQSIDPETLLAELREHAKIQGGGTKAHWPDEDVYLSIKEGLTKLRGAIDKVVKANDIDESATREAAEHGLRLARLAVEAIAAYDKRKQTEGWLDFDDLLLKTRALLQENPGSVCEAASDAIEVLLVDEFQDTDPIQADILKLLAGTAEFQKGRLFIVGDHKQSIYRFRRADPKIFRTFSEGFPEPGQLDLRENFRSVPGVLDFVNALFDGVYRDEDLKTNLPVLEHERAIEFLWADETDPDSVEKSHVDQRRRVEARWLARHINNRLREGWTIRFKEKVKIGDKEKEVWHERLAHAGDIVYLFRALTDSAAYESALVQEGLDYYIEGGSAFFAQQEVLDLINVLSAIEDPFDPLALAGALRSPFFCVSDEGLYWLATSAHGELGRGFDAWEKIGELSSDDRTQISRAHDLLGRWRADKDRGAIAALVARVVEESGYEVAVLPEFLGTRKRANVRKFVRLARKFDNRGGFTLADFVDRLRADLRKPPREEQAATTDEETEAVRLMTIHQAKGREFPIVVIPDLDRDAPATRDWAALHPELGMLVKPPNDDEPADGSGQSLGWTVYRELERAEEQDEALRLFYVATTRAQSALILSAGISPDQTPKSPALKLLHDQFDPATGECRAPLPDGWRTPRVRVIDQLGPPATGPTGEHRTRPRLLDLAQLIINTTVEPESVQPRRPRRPRHLNLDPASGLGPTAARVDRLVRAVLADVEALNPVAMPRVVARLAHAQTPFATPDIQKEAAARLAPWVASPLALELGRSIEVRRAIPWVVVWPPDDPNPTVVDGQIDFAYRDPRGDWCLVLLADASTPEPRERLRLLLSAQAAPGLGLGPIARGWRVQLGPDAHLRGEDRFEPAAIDQAFALSIVDIDCKIN